MNKKTQSGIAHIVIVVIILAIALVGTLGFVFWQNFIQPKTTTTQTNKTTDKKSTDTPTTDEPAVVEDKNNLKITSWGIKGVYSGAHPINYSIKNDSYIGKYLSFTSDDLTGGCSGYSVAMIMRFTGDQKAELASEVRGDDNRLISEVFAVDQISQWGGNKHIGSYYYIYKSPQDGCFQSESSATYNTDATQISNDVHEFFGTLTAI